MYICGGSTSNGSGNAVSSVDVYDVVTKQMSTRADMSIERVYFNGAAVGNRVCVCGGYDTNGVVLDSTECFNPDTNSWTPQASMSTTRAASGLTVLEGRMYAIGGWGGSDNLNSCERFDIGENTWSSVGSLSVARHGLAAATMAGYIYAVGGHTGSSRSKVVERYASGTNKWERMGDLVTARRGLGAAVWNNQLVAVGGVGGMDTMEVYDREQNTWSTATPTLNTAQLSMGVVAV